MATLLKDLYGPEIPDRIAKAIVEVHPSFATDVTIVNTDGAPAALNIDLRVHFVKASGRTSPKVFKMRAVHLGPGERATATKLISLEQHTTRIHYPGEHAVDVFVNGVPIRLGSFVIE